MITFSDLRLGAQAQTVAMNFKKVSIPLDCYYYLSNSLLQSSGIPSDRQAVRGSRRTRFRCLECPAIVGFPNKSIQITGT